ncbi:hypothetical protein MTO96_000990 [Rhipicephalus appendiculatus]
MGLARAPVPLSTEYALALLQDGAAPSPLSYNAAGKRVDRRDDGPAAGTSWGASTLGSGTEWAGTDAGLMDEKAAGSERLGKAFSTSGGPAQEAKVMGPTRGHGWHVTSVRAWGAPLLTTGPRPATEPTALRATYFSGTLPAETSIPCDDFRSYVCSWWKPLDRFPELTISAQSDLVVKWIEGFGSMLETGAALDKSGVGQKVSQFYHSCMARTERTQGDADAFVAFIRTLGLTWPEMPQSDVRAMGMMLELNYRLAMPLWFSLSVARNAAQSGLRRLVLKPCCLGRLRFILWRNQQAVDKDLYYDYWVAHYEALLGRKSVSRDRNEVNDLAREEAHIAEELAKLSEVYPSVPLLLRFAEHRQPHQARILQRLANPGEQFVQMHAWIVDSTLLEMWGQNYWQIYEPILCARETEVVYRPAVAALYVGQIATPQERSQLDDNLTDLRHIAAEMYASSTWFDQASRNVAIEKLRSMSVGLWPPEPFFDQSKLRTMYAKFLNKNVTAVSWVRLWISAQETMRRLSGTSLHDVTMSMRSALFPFLFEYDYLTNKVDVAVSALAKPLYCPQGTPGMFYGSIAFAFTLSMMKMQDLTGLKLYANGTLVEAGRWSWLSDSTAEAYKQKAECLAGGRNRLVRYRSIRGRLRGTFSWYVQFHVASTDQPRNL